MDTCVSTTTITTSQLQVLSGITTLPVTDGFGNNVYLLPCAVVGAYSSSSASTTDIVGFDLVATYVLLAFLWLAVFTFIVWLVRQFTL